MKAVVRTLIVAGALVAAGACNRGAIFDGGAVEVRVINGAPVRFDSVLVVFPRDSVHYGGLTPGQASAYRRVNQAYRYAYIEVWIDGESLILMPIDYVGESLLAPGRYTYRLGLVEQRYLTITFSEN